jgi:hypothetical protein
MQDRTLISLNDHQLSVVMTAAAALDVEKRDVFLQRVAALLRRQAGRIRWPDRFAKKSHQLRKRPKAAVGSPLGLNELGSRGRFRGAVWCAVNTNFGQCDRRFLRYPNRRVATSARPLTRRHLLRGHVGNPITNEAQLLMLMLI